MIQPHANVVGMLTASPICNVVQHLRESGRLLDCGGTCKCMLGRQIVYTALFSQQEPASTLTAGSLAQNGKHVLERIQSVKICMNLNVVCYLGIDLLPYFVIVSCSRLITVLMYVASVWNRHGFALVCGHKELPDHANGGLLIPPKSIVIPGGCHQLNVPLHQWLKPEFQIEHYAIAKQYHSIPTTTICSTECCLAHIFCGVQPIKSWWVRVLKDRPNWLVLLCD